MTKDKQRIIYITSGLKYLLAVAVTLLACRTTKNLVYLYAGLIELCIIFHITGLIVKKHVILGNIINDILMLLYLAQEVVLFFGNSYVKLVMLSNLESVQDLGGKAVQYLIGTVLVMVVCLLPVGDLKLKVAERFVLLLPAEVYLSEAVILVLVGTMYSPITSYGELLSESAKMNAMKQIDDVSEPVVLQNSEFYEAEVTDYRSKDASLPEKPNVVLIFTEGLSQNVIEDERNIMPNAAKLEQESIRFENYYNHTFATYRGLIGQLYSGYQLENTDQNYLVSLQDIFRKNGYHTAWINTEPNNDDFTAYLNDFGFDELLTSKKINGLVDSVSDKDAYTFLLQEMEAMNKAEEPFFTGIYTFGTHASLYSKDEVYKDGSNAFLNKFYNADYQLGRFLEAFNNSELADNTVLVFTADHCTYMDNDFANAFPDYVRLHGMCDRIPLCIYHKGIKPEAIDVDGRNSLGLAPTILDYLDLSDANYFIGSSLFSASQGHVLETVFNEEALLLSTKDSEIVVLSGSREEEMRRHIMTYLKEKSFIDQGAKANVDTRLGSDSDGSFAESVPEEFAVFSDVRRSMDHNALEWYQNEENET